MIKFIMKAGERNVLGIIIVKENIAHLLNDEPLHFDCEDMEMSELKIHEVLIAYYDTIELALASLRKHGLVNDDTPLVSETKTRH